MWYIETLPPQKGHKIKLVKTSVNSIELMWNGVPGVSHYLLQVQKVEMKIQPPVRVEPESKITSNLTVRKPIFQSPSQLQKTPTPQLTTVLANSNPMRVQTINQEIFKQPFITPPRHIIVNPKRSIGTSESSYKPNTNFDNRAIVIAKPITTYQIVKKIPRGSLGSFKITDKDGMPVNVVQKVSVNTVPSTSQFRIVENLKKPISHHERTVTYNKNVSAYNDDGLSENELPIDNHNNDKDDRIDQFDGVSDQETFQINNISNHHLGLDEANNVSNSNNENEVSGQNEKDELQESSNILTTNEDSKIFEVS